MFNDKELSFNLQATLVREASLRIIPIDEEHGVLAVVKPIGRGQAACIAFAPMVKLENPLLGFRPTFLRKVVTTDFPIREGRWDEVKLESRAGHVLQSGVSALMSTMDNATIAEATDIDTSRAANVSSSPDVAFTTFRAAEKTPIEKAIAHLMGANVRTESSAQ